MSNIIIDIAAQFTGQKAFNKSEQAIDKLGKSLKRALIGGSIAKLLTDSAKAFAADEKAAANLANTLQNLGLATFTASVEAMIDKTQLATGVLDEQLRPAFQKLVTSTGDAIQAQELLKLSLDVSAGSGQDLVTVASDIANVMAGNNKGLKKYALGLSAVELKTMSATEVQLKFLEVYGGASEKASQTFSGSMMRIKAAVEMARESLGKGLVDGLMIATGSQNIDELQQRILDFGTSAGNTFRTLGTVISENFELLKSLAITFAAIWTTGKVIAGIQAVISIVKALTATYKLLRATAVGAAIAQAALLNPLGALAWGATLVATITTATISIDKLGTAFNNADNEAKGLINTMKGIGNYQMSTGKILDLAKINASVDLMYTKKALAAKFKAEKAASDYKIKVDKAASIKDAALKKAAANFDLNKIQIAAALKATYDKDTRLRLLAMQAIENDNGEAALAYLKQLDILNKEILTNKLAGIKTISETELNYLNQMLLDELEAIRISGMSEADKAAARQAAYTKYNAAIVESGGLADKNFYSASTQADLLTIARLAGLDTVAAAQKTIDLFNYDEQIKIIDAVSAAQKIADDDKMKRLLEYLALLAKPIRLGGVLPFEDLPSTLGTGGAPVITGNTGTGVVAVIPETNVPVTGTSSMFNPYGVTPGSSAGAGTQGNFDYGTVNITVEGSILNGDDFVSIVNEAILNGNKIGLSNLPAGFLPG